MDRMKALRRKLAEVLRRCKASEPGCRIESEGESGMK